jgi:methylaspartate ammonia-lyase
MAALAPGCAGGKASRKRWPSECGRGAIGLQDAKLIAYAEAIVRRIGEIGAPDYLPRIHLDVYGTLGASLAATRR